MRWSTLSILPMIACALICVFVFIEVTGPLPESAITKWAKAN